ncbi:MAG: hypothetical protein UW03_C0002G0054 [Candidatus Peregrinibacteria bacterium GW2011_GWA2_43_8]|nr:MAG: hypothetical protein UW03_C0002G0054 [Candidatus Peregrinibacteria bacterium GW2011_GWA2_43_8]
MKKSNNANRQKPRVGGCYLLFFRVNKGKKNKRNHISTMSATHQEILAQSRAISITRHSFSPWGTIIISLVMLCIGAICIESPFISTPKASKPTVILTINMDKIIIISFARVFSDWMYSINFYLTLYCITSCCICQPLNALPISFFGIIFKI